MYNLKIKCPETEVNKCLIFSKLINTFQEKALNDIPKYKSLLEEFINQELIDQKKLVQMYGAELKQGSKDSPPTEVYNY